MSQKNNQEEEEEEEEAEVHIPGFEEINSPNFLYYADLYDSTAASIFM
jgi:hypothetical protein